MSLEVSRNEIPALRRVGVLLERVRQDARSRDPALEALVAGIAEIEMAAREGRGIREASIGRAEALLARIAPSSPSTGGTLERIRNSVLSETREVLSHLSH